MDPIVTVEGSSNSEVNMLSNDFICSLREALENYWVSRSLIMVGVVVMFIFPWYLTMIVLTVDMVLQNPPPLRPRDTATRLFRTTQMYWQHYKKRNLKKPE